MQYQQRHSFSLRKNYRENNIKKNGITVRRIQNVGVLTLFKEGTWIKFPSTELRGFLRGAFCGFLKFLS
jgi:hypothetical protein